MVSLCSPKKQALSGFSFLFSQTGKINVEKLADILAVEQFTVEKAIEDLLNTKDWTVIDDLVLTP